MDLVIRMKQTNVFPESQIVYSQNSKYKSLKAGIRDYPLASFLYCVVIFGAKTNSLNIPPCIQEFRILKLKRGNNLFQ